jgi:hypothetical protein
MGKIVIDIYLCDKKNSNKLKDKFYRTAIKTVILYGAEYCTTKGLHI